MIHLKESIEEKIKKFQKKKQSKLIWIEEEWENDKFVDFITNLSEQPPNGYIVDDGRNDLIRINKFSRSDLIIKKFNLIRTYDKLRFCFLDSKAVRSLRIALALDEIGINTPPPVAVVEERDSFNQLLYSYYITDYIDYDYNLLKIVSDNNHPRREQVKELLPGIARDVRAMHDAGIIHNDLHAGNILIKDIDENPEFYYIDLNRGRIKNKLSIKQQLKDLARFDLTEEEQEIFMKHYAPGKYEKLLDLMIKQRQKRENFLQWKRSIRSKIKFWE